MEKYWELTVELPNYETHEVINEFLLSLKLANRSPSTVKLYRCFYEKFFTELNKSYKKLTSEEILAWFHEYQKNVKEATLLLKMSVLSSFYKFCVEEEYLGQSPMKSRWFPRLPKSLPKYLEKKEIAKMRQQTEKNSLRNQLIVEFLLTSGCRVAEAVALNREDINIENRTANVLGKGRKIRKIHFSEKCAILFERYFEEVPGPIEALFVQSTRKRIGVRVIQIIMNTIGKEIKLQGSLHPHRLRHTFATELVTKGAELSFISEELGHSSIETTQIYARIPNAELITMYRKYMG